MRGFESTSTAVLEILRSNLLSGLDKVAATIEAGTFEVVGEKGRAPASQAGHLTLSLLIAIDAELQSRNKSVQ